MTVDLGEIQEIYKVGYVGRYSNSNGRFEQYGIAVSTMVSTLLKFSAARSRTSMVSSRQSSLRWKRVMCV